VCVIDDPSHRRVKMSFSQVPEISQEHSYTNSYRGIQDSININNRLHTTQVHDAASCRLVEAATCNAFKAAPADVRSLQRCKRSIAQTRQIAMYLAHVGLGLSLTASGRGLGRDRTTVRYACTRIEDARDDVRFDQALSALERGLNAFCGQFAQDYDA
jgi:chromosomal replication initiation ATPase DnaA